MSSRLIPFRLAEYEKPILTICVMNHTVSTNVLSLNTRIYSLEALQRYLSNCENYQVQSTLGKKQYGLRTEIIHQIHFNRGYSCYCPKMIVLFVLGLLDLRVDFLKMR